MENQRFLEIEILKKINFYNLLFYIYEIECTRGTLLQYVKKLNKNRNLLIVQHKGHSYDLYELIKTTLKTYNTSKKTKTIVFNKNIGTKTVIRGSNLYLNDYILTGNYFNTNGKAVYNKPSRLVKDIPTDELCNMLSFYNNKSLNLESFDKFIFNQEFKKRNLKERFLPRSPVKKTRRKTLLFEQPW